MCTTYITIRIDFDYTPGPDLDYETAKQDAIDRVFKNAERATEDQVLNAVKIEDVWNCGSND